MKQRKWSRPLRREKWFHKNWRPRRLFLTLLLFVALIALGIVFLLSLFLKGYNQNEWSGYLDFTIVPMNLPSNPELEELIVLEADIRGSELRLTLHNNSDETFVYTDFHGNIHSRIRFFDGENWRIVPHHPDVIIEQEDSAEFLYPHTRWRWTVDLTDYYLSESGLFRYVIGIAVGHTVFVDFYVE